MADLSKVCPHCRKAHPAVRDAAGKIVILPHSPSGGERVFGQTCGAKR